MSVPALRLQSHFEHKVDAEVYPVLPGDHLVISDPKAAVSTLLGSCVAACIRDRVTGLGGLNHFLLPGSDQSASARYGVYAMEVLVNEILANGGQRVNLEAKVFGGAEVLASTGQTRVGQKNAAFVKDYLNNEGIGILAQDLGGTAARRVYFFPASGKVRVQYLAATESKRAAESEAKLNNRLESKPTSGSVELFQ
ncbi:MAG: chemoreceptor glutamine deamidase CheD [Pseudomonadota bacterium]